MVAFAAKYPRNRACQKTSIFCYMHNEFPVVVVTKAAYELSKNETMGSKYKFWFEHEELGLCLYKQVRQNLGEDWAEKVAAELCKLLRLPHADYELAETWEGRRGIASLKFLQEEGETLVNGNELLVAIVPDYVSSATYGASQHTIDVVLKVIGNESINLPLGWTAPISIKTAVDVFVGYLLLDAWIGNGDRHHENWGVIRKRMGTAAPETIYLAPTYDHASSLGRELSDEKRQKRSVEAYANKCSSAFYRSVGETKPLKTFDVFTYVARTNPEATNIWLERLGNIDRKSVV